MTLIEQSSLRGVRILDKERKGKIYTNDQQINYSSLNKTN